MARRSLSVSLLVGVLVAALLPLASSAAEPPPLPASMAAVGDSITQAASSGGGLGTDYPANSWATGTNTTVNSHYARLRVLNGAISGHVWNDSVSGAHMADLEGQMRALAARLGIAVPEDRWPALAQAATFEEMRRNADRFAPAVTESLWRDNRSFFRRGTSGQWRDLFEDGDRARYDARVRELAADPAFVAWVHGGAATSEV